MKKLSIIIITVTAILIVIYMFNRDNSELEGNNKEDVETTKNVVIEEIDSNEESDKPNIMKKDPVLIDGGYYIDDILIVNKTFPLDKDFIPQNTFESINNREVCKLCIDIEAYNNFLLMKKDMKDLGLNIWIQSGYRSYSYQKSLYDRYYNESGEIADTFSARAGHSEHQSGLTFDLNTITDEFAFTDEGIWVNSNAHKYGFIIRYPKDKKDITGFKYEPWHLRYVGKNLATILYNDGNWITLEEYFEIDSEYKKNYR